MKEEPHAGGPPPAAEAACPAPAGRKPAPRRKARRKRPVRWTARRETLFLEALAETSSIAGSARAAGLPGTATVYRRRASDPDFRQRWMAALREGFVRLEADLLHRALNGTRKDVWHGGKKVGTVVERSERLALALLAAHRTTVMGADQAVPPSAADLRQGLIARLDEMHARLDEEG